MITTPAQAGKRAQELANITSISPPPINSSDSSSVFPSLQSLDMDTVLAHAGVQSSSGQTSSSGVKGGDESDLHKPRNLPLAPPLEFATTYTRPAEGPYAEGDSVYSRADNPTRLLLEQAVSRLECHNISMKGDSNMDGEGTDNNDIILSRESATTCAFASGMMAASSVILAHTMPITVLLPQDLYHGVSTVLTDVFQERFGIQIKYVDMVEVADQQHDDKGGQLTTLEKELRETLLVHHQEEGGGEAGSVIVWMETPSNPCCHVLDMASICDMVNRVRVEQSSSSSNNAATTITTIVDSTLAPPVIQQPLEFGVDVVMHSGTKYFGGHSDVLLGITTASPFTIQGQRLAPLLRQVQQCVGGVASPMDSWLTLRGLRTLHVRVERQSQTALAIAEHFFHQNSDPSSLVTAVHYPGLASHPQHDVAKRQTKNNCFGGVLSVELKSEHAAMAFAGALQTIHRATSLGGTETLIEHRASIEPPNRTTSPPGLLRMAVGLEDASDLICDIDRALAIAQQVEKELV